MRMGNTIVIVGAVLLQAWVFADRWPREMVLLPIGLIVALTIRHDFQHQEWGFAPRAFPGGLIRALAVTLLLGLLVLGAGAALGTLHDRRDFLGGLWPLILWGGAQQWVLQTVVLRESQRATSRDTGIVLAAVLFGAVHLPNPFLAPVTAFAGLIWCRLYDRYPNVLPLALSHALGTLAVVYAFNEPITGRLRIGAAYLRLGE
jgi:membrane protease YdiL (CAAX protease family)